MPDEEQSGPSRATLSLIVVLALPVVLVLVFLVVGHVRSGQEATVPAVGGKGLKIAEDQIEAAGFGFETHDALGRDRGQRNPEDWQVCAYDDPASGYTAPATGSHPRNTKIQLPVVKLNEDCPHSDQGVIAAASTTMPPLVNLTAHMAQKAFGDHASIQFVDVANRRRITGSLGDWRVCAEKPLAKGAWNGVPVALAVIPYDINKQCDPNTDYQTLLQSVLNDFKRADN